MWLGLVSVVFVRFIHVKKKKSSLAVWHKRVNKKNKYKCNDVTVESTHCTHSYITQYSFRLRRRWETDWQMFKHSFGSGFLCKTQNNFVMLLWCDLNMFSVIKHFKCQILSLCYCFFEEQNERCFSLFGFWRLKHTFHVVLLSLYFMMFSNLMEIVHKHNFTVMTCFKRLQLWFYDSCHVWCWLYFP